MLISLRLELDFEHTAAGKLNWSGANKAFLRYNIQPFNDLCEGHCMSLSGEKLWSLMAVVQGWLAEADIVLHLFLR